MFHRRLCLFILLLSSASWAQGPLETPKAYGESFTVYIENDTRRLGGPNSDEGYTSGIRFSYIYAEDKVPQWIPTLTDWSLALQEEFKKSTTNFGISLAQQMYTPKDTDERQLILNDRPYASWLYLGFTANFKTPTHSHSLELDIGVVGPEALGENAQNGFHRLIDVPESQGWDHQLATEPTLQLSYTQKLRFLQLTNSSGRYFDFIPYFGASFGNVMIGTHAGLTARLGVDLPDDFGAPRLSSANGEAIVNNTSLKSHSHWWAYGFAGIKGNGILRNIFLDGNTFRDSHRVKKYPFTVETEFGYALQITNWSLSWRFITVSPEFEQRNNFNSYASISISYFRDF